MDYEQLLRQLKEIRRQKGISLRKMGEKLGVSGQYLSMIERGKVPLKVKDFFLMCSILEVSPKDIMVKKGNIKRLRKGCRRYLKEILK